MESKKLRKADGTVVIKCETCKHWRHYTAFLIGEKNTKKKECWVPTCVHCRQKVNPYGPDIIEAIEKPDDASWSDEAGACHCGDGLFTRKDGKKGGICYRCQGTAKLTWYDMARNYCYDLLEANRQIRRDMGNECYDGDGTISQPEEVDDDLIVDGF